MKNRNLFHFNLDLMELIVMFCLMNVSLDIKHSNSARELSQIDSEIEIIIFISKQINIQPIPASIHEIGFNLGARKIHHACKKLPLALF